VVIEAIQSKIKGDVMDSLFETRKTEIEKSWEALVTRKNEKV